MKSYDLSVRPRTERAASEDINALSGPTHANYISTHIGRPHRLQWIEASYHRIHLDRQHRKVADLTADFLEASHVATCT